jgi:GDP-mannose pyrophosphatase NudK
MAMKMDGETVHIREIETVADRKGKLMRVDFEQRRRNGELQCREREVYDNGDSAVILPHDPHRDTVLLAWQLRLPIFLRDGTERTLEACAGKLEGELAEPRIVKEVEEELGYRIAKVHRLFDLCESGHNHGKDRLLHLRVLAGRQGLGGRRAEGRRGRC